MINQLRGHHLSPPVGMLGGQCKKSLEHLERIIKVKADVLSKPNPKRKEPKFVFFVV
jgi:hypothetical protein